MTGVETKDWCEQKGLWLKVFWEQGRNDVRHNFTKLKAKAKKLT